MKWEEHLFSFDLSEIKEQSHINNDIPFANWFISLINWKVINKLIKVKLHFIKGVKQLYSRKPILEIIWHWWSYFLREKFVRLKVVWFCLYRIIIYTNNLCKNYYTINGHFTWSKIFKCHWTKNLNIYNQETLVDVSDDETI